MQAGTSITAGGTLVLGQEQDTVGGGFDRTQAFLGKMDEFALYRDVLTATQAKAHHDAGVTAPVCTTAAAVVPAARVEPVATDRRSEFLPEHPEVGRLGHRERFVHGERAPRSNPATSAARRVATEPFAAARSRRTTARCSVRC